MPWAEKQSTALTRDQLIDYLFSHGDYDQMLDPQWIVDNLRNWRGIGNRLPETKGKYIGVLAKSADNYFTRVILDIMESVKSRAEWDAMMGDAGSKRAIRVALHTLKRRHGTVPVWLRWSANEASICTTIRRHRRRGTEPVNGGSRSFHQRSHRAHPVLVRRSADESQ
jgi:hypothetical protein